MLAPAASVTPQAPVSDDCGSMSTSRTRRPVVAASTVPSTCVVAVLPTPPLWFAMAMVYTSLRLPLLHVTKAQAFAMLALHRLHVNRRDATAPPSP